MQTAPVKVSNALQCIHHEIDSQLMFLTFKAGCGNWHFTINISYFLYA